LLDLILLQSCRERRLDHLYFHPQMASMLPLPDWANVAFNSLSLVDGYGVESAWGAFKLTFFYLLGRSAQPSHPFSLVAAFSNLMLDPSLFFALPVFT